MPTFSLAMAGFKPADTFRHAYWLRHFADTPVSAIKRKDIVAALDSMVCGGASKNRYIAQLGAAFTWLVEREVVDSSPIVGIKRHRENPGRTRWLKPDEQTRLLVACKASRNRDLYPMFALALASGLRRSELWRLRREDIEAEYLLVKLGKNKRSRKVPLNALSREALALLPQEGKLFPRKWFPRAAWTAALKKAGISDCCWHSATRHTWATSLSLAGLDIPSLKEAGGWLSNQVLRYAHGDMAKTSAVMQTVFDR